MSNTASYISRGSLNKAFALFLWYYLLKDYSNYNLTSNSSFLDKKKRFTPTSHSKRRKSPAVKALRPVRGALNLSLTSHCPLTYQEIKLYLSY